MRFLPSDGAIGVDENICNGKLLLSQNEDWQAFADKMEKSLASFLILPQPILIIFIGKKLRPRQQRLLEPWNKKIV